MNDRLYRLENHRPHDFGGPLDRDFEPLEEPARLLPLHQLIERHAGVFPRKPAVVTPTRSLDFGELVEMAARFAAALAPHVRPQSGVQPVFCPSADSCIQVAVALACWRLGLAHAPIDPDMPHARFAGILAAAPHPVVVAEGAVLDALGDLLESGDVIDAALENTGLTANLPDLSSPEAAGSIVFTSGSTGVPKGIVHNQRSLALQMAAKVRNGHLNSDDCAVYVGAIHVAGWLRNALPLLAVGATALFLPAATPVDRILELNRAYNVTVFGSYVGTARLLARHTLAVSAFSGVRILTMFGDALGWPDIDALRAVLPPDAQICSSYSQSEHWRISSWFIEDGAREEGARVPVGFLAPDTSAALLVDHDQDDPVGEVVIAGPLLAMGSWPDPARYEERLVVDPAEEEKAYFRTGDILRLREDGMLVFVGRVDNQVKLNGWRIEPEEIELVAGNCPQVDAAACVVRRDTQGNAGQLVLFVTAHDDSDDPADAVLHHLRGRLPPYMVPSVVTVLDALPLTQTGKTDRPALIRIDTLLAEESRRDRTSATLEELWPEKSERRIAMLISQEIRQPFVRPDQSLIEAFGDSLEALTIALEIEKQFGVSLDPVVLLGEEPLGAIVADVAKRAAKA